MIDNSDLQRKIQIRQKGVSLLRSETLFTCDLYAGEGHICDLLWRHISKYVVAVEKIQGKFKLKYPNIELIEGDNKNIELLNFNIIDADAYGLVLPMLKKTALLKGERLVCFTEFNPIAHKNRDWQSQFIEQILQFDPTAFYVEKAKTSAALYGFIYYGK